MIDSLSGEVVRIASDHLVVDTGGVAYRAYCAAGTLRSCTEGHSALVYIHLIVRDDSIQLYGFASPSERDLFLQLLSVGQVGPRLALQILSALPPDQLIETIASRNIDRLVSIKGIGRKTAERILVDLRDKIGQATGGEGGFLLTQSEETAFQALTSRTLGFTAREAREVLGKLRGEDLSPEELVRRALELLGPAR